jgi:hypothetical protein
LIKQDNLGISDVCLEGFGRIEMSLAITIAAPFRHARKDRLKKSEIVYYLAFERGWMNIEQANLLLARAYDEGLIALDGDMIRPLFDPGSVEIPLGFRPSASVFRKDDPLEELMKRIEVERRIPRITVVADMNAVISREFDGLLRPEAALVIIARRNDVQYEDLLPALRDNILKNK